MSGETTRFEIRDAHGVMVAVHVRRDRGDGRKAFWWEQPDGERGLKGRSTAQLPLYGSEEVTCWRVDEPIIVVEGEKARDVLKGAAIPALATVTGASGCPGSEALSVVAGRKVILWPDADAPGRKHMARLAAALDGLAGEVRVFEWGGAHDGDDAFDYFAAGPHRADALRQEITNAVPAAEWTGRGAVSPGATRPKVAAGAAVDDKEPIPTSRPTSQATRIAALADGAELCHTPSHEAFVSVEVNGHRENMRVDSTEFRRWLRQQWFAKHESAAPSLAVTEAVASLEARACYTGAEVEVFTRIAAQEDRIYIDLANRAWEVIEITPHGWQVMQQAPVKFRHPRGMFPLPSPDRGGTVELLRPFVNVSSSEDWILITSWVVASLRPQGPYPVLGIHGEQGSAKSTTARILRSLVDPNKAALRSEPTCARDLMISATNSWMQVFDNVSRLPPWLSDALCRLATGGAFATRELYSNAEEAMFQAARPVLLNGIGELATRSDLIDRTILLTLPRIPEDRRRPEADFWREFEQVRPAILGALFDILSIGLRVNPGIRLRQTPRMADFATWCSSASVGFRWGPGAFGRAYAGNRQAAHEVALEGSRVALVAQKLVAENGVWEGTASELLDRLAGEIPGGVGRRSGLPGNARALSDELRRLAPNLRAAGLCVEFRRAHGGRRIVRLSPSGDSSVTCVPSVSATGSPAAASEHGASGPHVSASPCGGVRHPTSGCVTATCMEGVEECEPETQVTQVTLRSVEDTREAAQ